MSIRARRRRIARPRPVLTLRTGHGLLTIAAEPNSANARSVVREDAREDDGDGEVENEDQNEDENEDDRGGRRSMTAHIECVEGLIADWARRDVDAVLDRLTDDVVYHFHVGSRPLRGKEWVRRFLEKFGAGQTDVRWRIVHHAQNGDVLLVEGVDDYVDPKGRRIRTPYMGAFEFRGGQICQWRDYLDLGLVARVEAGEPMPEWIEELVA